MPRPADHFASPPRVDSYHTAAAHPAPPPQDASGREPDAAAALGSTEDSAGRRRPRGTRRTTVLIALGTFVLGAALATGVTAALTTSRPAVTGTSGTTTAPGGPVSSDAGLLYQMQATPGGDVQAADRLLRREAFNADVVTGMVGDYIDRSSTRRLFGQGSTIVYAARGEDKDYCLILKLNDVSTWTCTGPDQFAAQGLEVELKASADHVGPSTAARWNGVFVELVRVPSN